MITAVLKGPSAQFDVDVSLGSLSLYVPSDWRVHINVDNLTSKDLYIKGEVSLGNLESIYVGENVIN